jgi:hypothetical protein
LERKYYGSKIMKRLLTILLTVISLRSCVFAQVTTIYQTGFETGFDGWKSTMTSYRVGVTYGIHPVGSYMWDNSIALSVLTRKLNLKKGITYSFSFKYNNSLTGGHDTTFIVVDTSLTYPTAAPLAGTTKIGLPTAHTGIGDNNWQVVNFSVTPTANGGYWQIDTYHNYSEVMIDSMTVTGDITVNFSRRLRVRK